MSDTAHQQQIQKLRSEHKQTAETLLLRDLELSRARAELQVLDREKSEFVSIAAHQLRTPLSAMLWAHQMLIDEELGNLNSKQKQMLEQSRKSIERMVDLVKDLLSADHLEFRQVIYDFKHLNINYLVTEVVDELMPMAQERNISVSLQLPEMRPEIKADPQKLKEAFLNVLNNAIKYSPPNGQVTVTLSVHQSEIRVQVVDRGIGIPKKDHHRMFEKFSRSDNAKKIDADGSGLGLFIVKKIIEAHDGSITFTSEEDKGTIFVISLPLKQT